MGDIMRPFARLTLLAESLSHDIMENIAPAAAET
jgi:hypothetical protein